MMNSKVYRVCKVLLDSPNTEHSISEIAYHTNFTLREVTHIVNSIPEPFVRTEYKRTIFLSVSGTPDEIEELKKNITDEKFDVTPEIRDSVVSMVPMTKGISALCIARDTDLSINAIAHILRSDSRISTTNKGLYIRNIE